MRALVQRVLEAQVEVNGKVVGACEHGLLVFVGVGNSDDEASARRLWHKLLGLRIFADEQGKTNLSLADIGGDVLLVSQFTLFADCKKGMRPSFAKAAPAPQAERLYDYLCELAERDVAHVGRGVFGANMRVSLINDGPFTIWLDMD